MDAQMVENKDTVVNDAVKHFYPSTLTMPANPLLINKLYFSPKKAWVFAAQHGY
jgi:hypothetical protein